MLCFPVSLYDHAPLASTQIFSDYISNSLFYIVEIDCGNPPSNITGANFTYPSNLKYGSMFEFSCSSLFYVDGKSVNGSSDIEVICGADGQWDLGSLQCLGWYQRIIKIMLHLNL